MVYVIVLITSEYFPMLTHRQHLYQTLYFAAGVITSCIFHSFRFRFLPFFLILLLILGAITVYLDNIALGEFDFFFLSVKFLMFRCLFLLGWICGWGFSRSKYFPAVLSVIIMALGIAVTALSGKITVAELVKSFVPAPVFAFYIIFMNELLRNTDEEQFRSWLRPFKGLLIYAAAMALLLYLSFNILKKEIAMLETKWDNEKQTEKGDNLYNILPDSTLAMKQNMKVTDNLSRDGEMDNEVLFVAYINNFFPYSDIPNPLYLASEYLTLFDDETETFEKDTAAPDNDKFHPDPSQIPLYFALSDSAILQNEQSLRYRKIIETEIYKIKLSDKEFTAPSTAFFCQPVAVRKDLMEKYTSAYRAKSNVSELNSAYFVYNNMRRDMVVSAFQEQRFELLREIKNYNSTDSAFLKYFTAFPANEIFDTIKVIAQEIAAKAEAVTPIDKVIAIRDYFMQTDEFGEHLYKYSNVGTTVPSGSKILNFILNEHIGNCTYYAGSTFLLLRACGIPARIVTGFAVIDRSSNNKGWYWVYGKQSHAWVQVFFPEYGWLDFDTTFSDSEQAEAPSTDGTPPLDPQTAWFAGSGKVLTVDTVRKSAQFLVEKFICFDKEYKPEKPFNLKLDLSLAEILRDSLKIKIRDIIEKENGLALSFTFTDEVVQNRLTTGSLETIIKNIPNPFPTDQLRLTSDKKEEQTATKKEHTKTGAKKYSSLLTIILILILLAILLTLAVLSLPYFIFTVYSRRAKRIEIPENEAYYPYRAAMFMLCQLGYIRKKLTPLQYAGQVIDSEFGTAFEAFTATYLKVKYARQELTNEDRQRILTFYVPFKQAVMSKIKLKKRICSFINIYNTLEFFTKSKE
jgi:transglutaminase-like putative cysteine protease